MKFILTQQGIKLHAWVEAGLQLVISRAEASENLSENPDTLTGLDPANQVLQLNRVTSDGDRAIITLSLSNMDVQETYTLHTIGVYALDQNGEEILFLIGQDETGEEIKAASIEEVILEYNIALMVSNASQVTFIRNLDDYVRRGELDALLRQIQDQLAVKAIGYDEEAEALIWGGGVSSGSGSGNSGYILPAATATRLGGVKIGSGIAVAEDGTISFDASTVKEAEAEVIVLAGTQEITAQEVTELYESDD